MVNYIIHSMKLVNRVAESGLKTINLEDFFPIKEMISFDLKDYLFKGLILKEKEFRLALKEHDWSQYQDKIVLVFCSTDAIIPVWAYMLIANKVTPYAHDTFQGTQAEYLKAHYKNRIDQFEIDNFSDQKIVIKGCSEKPVPPAAYLELTKKLTPIVQSLMYGEPCSTVPIYKRPKLKTK